MDGIATAGGSSESRELIQALVADLSEGVLVCDRHGEVVAVNRVFERLLLLRSGWREERDTAARLIQRCLAVAEVPQTILAESGNAPVPRLTVKSVPLPGGLISIFVTPAPDEASGAESDSLDSEMLRDILDAVDGSIVVYDRHDRFVMANRRYFELYPHLPDDGSLEGLSFEEMLRTTLRAGAPADLQAIDDPEGFVERRLREWRTTGDREQLHPSGRWDLIRRRETRNGSHVTLRVDITSQKRLQDELRAVRDELLAASEAKSRFLASMSHELRTPLNAIIGFAEVLGHEHLGPVGSPRYREYARDIMAAGRHLLDLIGTVLDLGKIEAGEMTLEETTFDLVALLERQIGIMRTTAAERGNRLRLLVDAPGMELTADRQLVAQMVLNLLSNAVKFTSDGVITVRVERLGSGASTIAVEDTGRGMPADVLGRLGKPFYQAGHDAVAHHRGTGLGLSIVKEMMGLHGGSFTVESEEGVGTTATLFFPPRETVGSVPAGTWPASPVTGPAGAA